MNVTDLRAAITLNGGTPASYDRIYLLRQLVTAYGGTATQYSIVGLLREAVTAAGGTPTQWAVTGLERELLTALGASASSFDGRVNSGLIGSTASGPSDLITNGAFDSGASWTLSQIGGSMLPTIGAGKLNSSAGNEGNIQRATQVLAGGTSAAGTYRVTLDTTVGSGVDIVLLGAADQNRGTGAITAAVAGTADIIASGEVSKIRLSFENDGTIDNVKLEQV